MSFYEFIKENSVVSPVTISGLSDINPNNSLEGYPGIYVRVDGIPQYRLSAGTNTVITMVNPKTGETKEKTLYNEGRNFSVDIATRISSDLEVMEKEIGYSPDFSRAMSDKSYRNKLALDILSAMRKGASMNSVSGNLVKTIEGMYDDLNEGFTASIPNLNEVTVSNISYKIDGYERQSFTRIVYGKDPIASIIRELDPKVEYNYANSVGQNSTEESIAEEAVFDTI